MARPTIDPEALYQELGHLVSAMPDWDAEPVPSASTLQWFGRACARVSATGDDDGAQQLRSKLQNWLQGYQRPADRGTVAAILYSALAVAELGAPASVQGTFIAAGNAFDAMMAVGKVLRSATKSVLVVDPYMDSTALTDFMVQAPDGVAIQLLADQADHKPSLKPAVSRWAVQHGAMRPIEARLAAPRALHDRLIAIDGTEVWILTQSFNALAARSPATIARVHTEIAALKIAAYQTMWNGATPI